jgi:S1-C subfamily serine protease
MRAEKSALISAIRHRLLVPSLCVVIPLAIARTQSAEGNDAQAHYGLVASDFDELSRVATSALVESTGAIPRTAAWPFFAPRRRGSFDNERCPATPHPAVARIIAPEHGATAFGSGTLIDVRDQFGLVVTNWHVVRDAVAAVEVAFPNGFRSHARPLKVDQDWDLAALVIWRPTIEPVPLAAQPPRPGDVLTIHGYGQGPYRIATGRCTQYYAPHANYPLEMLELDVEARQGDSGGPIFNERGELAGVLFGAGQGTTFGSFGPRVSTFLATLAPDIGQARDQAGIAVAERQAPKVVAKTATGANAARPEWPSSPWKPAESRRAGATLTRSDLTGNGWYEPVKSLLAVVGLAAIALRLVKAVR